jgi:hypothetical protein
MDAHTLLCWWWGVGFVSALCLMILSQFYSSEAKNCGIVCRLVFVIAMSFAGFGGAIILVFYGIYFLMYKKFPNQTDNDDEDEDEGFNALCSLVCGISVCCLMAICIGSLGGDALDSLERGAKIQQEQMVSEDMIAFKGWSKISGNRFELTFEEWQILKKQGLMKAEKEN